MKTILIIASIAAVFILWGCATPGYYTRHNERRDRDRYHYNNRYDRYHYHAPYYRPRYRSNVGVSVWFY